MVKNAWETLGSSELYGLPKLKSRARACGRARQVVRAAGRADNYLKLSCFLDKCIFGSGWVSLVWRSGRTTALDSGVSANRKALLLNATQKVVFPPDSNLTVW